MSDNSVDALCSELASFAIPSSHIDELLGDIKEHVVSHSEFHRVRLDALVARIDENVDKYCTFFALFNVFSIFHL